jgi:formate hydrogenlyase subunit 4
MSIVLSLLTQILHIALIVIAAPTLAGAMDWLEARFAERSGPPILMPWRDLLRLSRKTPMATENVSLFTRAGPAIALGATLSAAALIPSFTLGMAFSPLADILVVASLLTVARVAGVLAALDAGAAQPGLIAQRSSALAVLAEPALLLSVVALALMAGSFNLDLIIGQQREGVLLPAAASAFVFAALVALVFADTSTTDPAGHAIYSGTSLATVRMTDWCRRVVLLNLIGGLFLPIGIATADAGPAARAAGLLAWACKLGFFAVCLSAIQTLAGRIPRRSLPDLIGVAALLALLAVVMILASGGMA